MDDTLQLFIKTQRLKRVMDVFFSKGSQVEVSSDDVGFTGAWYLATIVDIDVVDNPPPLPPPSSDNGSKKRKRKMTQEEEEEREASKEREMRYLVEYDTLLDEVEGERPLKEYVGVSYIRPLPPPTDDGEQEKPYVFEVNDVVDAFHRDGWWTGVITGVIDVNHLNDEPKFVVCFENPPDEIGFNRSELRVHYDWVDCKWVRAGKKEIIEPEGELSCQKKKQGRPVASECRVEKAARPIRGRERKKVRGSGTENPRQLPGKSSGKCVSNKKKHLNDPESHNTKEITEPKGAVTPVSCQKRKTGKRQKVLVERPTGEEKNGAEAASLEMVVKDCPTNEALQLTVAGDHFQKIMDSGHGYPPQLLQRQYTIWSNIMKLRQANMDGQLIETIAEKCGRKLKKGRSKRKNQTSMTNDESPSRDSQDAFGEKTSEVCDIRPQLTWYEGMNSPSTVGDSRTPLVKDVIQDENAMRSLAIASADDEVSLVDKDLPFEKRSPIWKTLESMEIFQKIPQQPHFSPLDKSKEESREGSAIGNMVTFTNVVERTSQLKFSDPRSVIESCLETLSGLEIHGFRVDPVRTRLNELLSMKDGEEKLLEESKGVDMKIMERNLEKRNICKEIREIIKMMKLLQGKLAKVKDHEIAGLKSKKEGIDRDIQNAQKDFERLAAAPW